MLRRSDPAQLVGVSGEDPRLSTKEFGERALTAILERMGEKATELLDEYDAAACVGQRLIDGVFGPTAFDCIALCCSEPHRDGCGQGCRCGGRGRW